MYRLPYEEYRTDNSDGASFATEIYDIVAVRRLRPTLFQQLKNNQYSTVGILVCCS